MYSGPQRLSLLPPAAPAAPPRPTMFAYAPGNQSSSPPSPRPPPPPAVRRAQPLFRPFPESPVPTLRHCSGLFGDLWILLPPTRPTVPAVLRFLLCSSSECALPPTWRFPNASPRSLPSSPTGEPFFLRSSQRNVLLPPLPAVLLPTLERYVPPFLFFDVFPVSLPGRSALREEPTCERLERWVSNEREL